jgi:hypothetical protein
MCCEHLFLNGQTDRQQQETDLTLTVDGDGLHCSGMTVYGMKSSYLSQPYPIFNISFFPTNTSNIVLIDWTPRSLWEAEGRRMVISDAVKGKDVAEFFQT